MESLNGVKWQYTLGWFVFNLILWPFLLFVVLMAIFSKLQLALSSDNCSILSEDNYFIIGHHVMDPNPN